MTKQKFDEFILAHGRDILWFCRMTTGNAQEGEELYQDTMLTLLEQIEKLDEANNTKSYALSVAVRLYKNRRRKFAWRMRIAPQESYEEHLQNGGKTPEHKETNPEAQILQEETIQEVQKMVQQLPEKYRLVVYLLFGGHETDGDCGVPASVGKYRKDPPAQSKTSFKGKIGGNRI